jgi:hypothetical protein
VGIDVFGDVYTGWDENLSGEDEGIARWDPEGGTLTFINEGLSSLLINEIRINPAMSAIALFCCTDSGAYVSYDYFVGINGEKTKEDQLFLEVYPNPASEYVCVSYRLPAQINKSMLTLYTNEGRRILLKDLRQDRGRVEFRTSEFTPGIYFVEMKYSEGMICRKLLVK